MTVEVAEEKYVSAFERALHHKLSVVVNRVEFAGRAYPLAVKILAHQRASIVTHDDAIGVKHRHDFENESVS